MNTEDIKNNRWSMGDGRDSKLYSNPIGRIIGEVGRVGTTGHKVYATVYPNATESISLGIYIDFTFASKAVETYWEIQSRTLIE